MTELDLSDRLPTKLKRRERSILWQAAQLAPKRLPGARLVLRDPDGVEHNVIASFVNDSLTACGLDTSEWDGFKVTDHPCPECHAVLDRPEPDGEQALIDEWTFAGESNLVTLREVIETREHLAVLIEQGADFDALDQATREVVVAKQEHQEVTAESKEIMRKAQRKFDKRAMLSGRSRSEPP